MKTALLIIDVQRGLFEVSPPPFEAPAVIERINRLADRARVAGTPVVFVQHERAGTALGHGSEGWLLHRDLVVQPTDLFVRKTSPDAFHLTNLDALLKTYQVTEVIATGYASEFCVDTTVRRAAALGYGVTLVSDAHTTHDKAHATALQIRAHENATLPDITSFGPVIKAVTAAELLTAG